MKPYHHPQTTDPVTYPIEVRESGTGKSVPNAHPQPSSHSSTPKIPGIQESQLRWISMSLLCVEKEDPKQKLC